MYCPNCGTPNADASRFCQKCGSALAAGSSTNPATPPVVAQPDEPLHRRAGLWLSLLVLAAIVVVAFTIVYVTNQNSGPVAAPVESLAAQPNSAPALVLTLLPTATLLPTVTTALTLTPTSDRPTAGDSRVNPVDGAKIVYLNEGEFSMGLTSSQIEYLLSICTDCKRSSFAESQPVHPVKVDAVWIYRTEVTNAMYAKCVEAGPCPPPRSLESNTRQNYYGNLAYDNYPVVHVAWAAADQYCRWAGGRLPTEAEWEKAARGVDGRLFPWGDTAPNSQLANIDPFVGDTSEAGSYPPGASPYGVLDMAGNVWEWVADWYDPTYYNESLAVNPAGPASVEKPLRSGRGGSWFWSAGLASSGFRDWWESDKEDDGVGFRCALDETTQ
jgi:eukaryotic-like serine/threonine-protein kinase